jgi:hypothetical protein
MSKPGNNSVTREWLGLKDLTEYAPVSERTLRGWIHSPVDPLPAVKVQGKILVRRSVFDNWLERHKLTPLARVDVDAIVQEVLKGETHGR